MGIKARERIIQIVSNSMAPMMRAENFQKSGLSFYRRLGDVVQVVEITLSAANADNYGHFNIHIGLNFDRVSQLEQKPVQEQPKEYQCQFRRRLEQVVASAPARWDVGVGTEQPGLVMRLQDACAQLLALLNSIDSIERLLATGWLRGQAELGLRAQIHYLLGNTQAAVLDLQDPIFQSRPNWDFDAWLAQRGLGALKGTTQND